MADDHSRQIAQLADRHGRMVFATAYRILGNADDAEDALQEVFLKMLNSRNGRKHLDAVQDWGAYLRVTASSCAVDLLRRRSKRSREKGTLSEEPATAIDQDPSRVASRRETAARLRQALAAMPSRDAAVFALRHFEDLSYKQIASQMDLSVDQVGVILHRTRKRLRDDLEPIRPPVSHRGRTAGSTESKPAKEDRHV
jgi:RNA polymerase sigma-70 factor (ECF subfamily)